MWLEQKKYTFINSDGERVNVKNTQQIVLSINGITTEIPIIALFKKFNNITPNGVIKGYSILQESDKQQNIYTPVIEFNDNKYSIGFIDIEKNQQVFISQIENPIIQWDDIEFNEKDFDNLVGLVMSVPQAELATGGDGSPHPSPNPEPKKYVIARQKLLDDGYIELVNNEYRLLMHNDHQPVLVVINENSYKPFKLKKTTNPNEFEFTMNGDLHTIKVDNNQFKIDQLVNI